MHLINKKIFWCYFEISFRKKKVKKVRKNVSQKRWKTFDYVGFN